MCRSKKGLWFSSADTQPGGSGSGGSGGSGSSSERDAGADAEAEARVAAQVAAAAAAAKRWSANSDEDEFEMVLAVEGELTPESVPLAQYKASERCFGEWPPENPFVDVPRVGMWNAASEDERQHAHELFSRWRLTLARTPPLLEQPAPAIRAALDIGGCPAH